MPTSKVHIIRVRTAQVFTCNRRGTTNLVDNIINNYHTLLIITITIATIIVGENWSCHATTHISLITLNEGRLQLKLCKISDEASTEIERSTKISLCCNCQKSVSIYRDVAIGIGSTMSNMHLFRYFQICHNKCN